MTVDWSGWLGASEERQAELWRQYREIVKAESDDARATNYARMHAAIREAGRLG